MRKLIAVTATVGLIAVGGAALALHEDSGEIRACWDAQGRLTQPSRCGNRHLLHWNIRGPRGFQGESGGFSGYEIVKVTHDLTGSRGVANYSVTCPAGKKVLSGGYSHHAIPGEEGWTVEGLPNETGHHPTADGSGWVIQAASGTSNPAVPQHLDLYAICADVVP
jgi:hypothetical protein